MSLAPARNGKPRWRGDRKRRCLGCGLSALPGDLIRLVRGEGGRLVLDVRRRAGGRGAHVCYSTSCIEQALKKRRMHRALRLSRLDVDVSRIVAGATGQLEAVLAYELTEAGRAGSLVVRPGRIRDALASRSVEMILVSREGVSEEVAWVDSLAQQQGIERFWVDPAVLASAGRGGLNIHGALAVKKGPLAVRLETILRHLDALGAGRLT